MTRNLLYHIYPSGNWLWNLEQLAPYLPIFNGKKLAAIAFDKEHSPAERNEIAKQVQTLLPGVRFQGFNNHPYLRETVSFVELLKRVQSKDPKEITFYAHTKGTTRTNEKLFTAVTLWAECLYKYNLSDIDYIEQLLEGHPAAGVFKRFGRFPHFPKASTWHYSGTFFWFRNNAVFAKEWEEAVVETRYGVEAFLSLLFDKKACASIYPWGIGNLYNLVYMKKVAKQLQRR